MLKKSLSLLLTTCCFFMHAFAQNITPQQYVEKYKDLAIREMKRMGVPAAITLAQGILETESGNSVLLKKSNNHFGIKCKNSWSGAGVSHDDDAIGECFRTYKDAEASYRDHSNFLRGSDRYAPLFKLNPTDYKAWAKGLKSAGYATNPKYPDILIKHIEQYNLQQYSLAAAGDVPKTDASQFEDDKEVNVDEVLDREEEKNATKISGLNETAKNATAKLALVNGSKCFFAKKGASLLAIATENNIALSRLLEINDLRQDGIIEKDQFVFLQKKSATGDKDFCVVKKGETVYDIAQNNGILLTSLLAYNVFTSMSAPGEGEKIYLRPGIGKTPTLPIVATKKIHEVQPKEGLYSISKKYNVSVLQLKEWNQLISDTLSIGQRLIIAK